MTPLSLVNSTGGPRELAAALRSGFTKNLPFGLIVALVLLAEMVIAVSAWKAGPVTGNVRPATATQPNIEAIGELLYTRFLFPFELAGLILLVAMIGAIVLTHRSRGGVRGQNVARQVDRKADEAIKLEQPKVSASSINTFQTTVDEVLRGDGRK